MSRPISGRHVRMIIAVVCIALALVVMVLHLMNVSTSDAVLDGRRVVIRAQISGQMIGIAPNVGDIVNKGDVVAEIAAQVNDRRNILSATALLNETTAKINALDAQSDTLTDLQKRLTRDADLFKKATVDSLTAQVAVAKSNVGMAEAAFKVATAEGNRARKMSTTGGMGASDIDLRLGNEIEAGQRLDGARADLVRLQGELKAFGLGINPRDGQNDVPYSRQRLDEMTIKQSDIANQRAVLDAQKASLQAEIERETAWTVSQNWAEARAASRSVIWRRPVASGTDVNKGDVLVELVDCGDIFVNARVPAKEASVIALGDEVVVDVAGYDRNVSGTVRIVRALSGTDPRDSEASGLQAPGAERWAEIEIEVDRADFGQRGGNFCGIGAGARVRFPVRSIFSSFIPSF